MSAARRRGVPLWLLAILFLAIPLLELYVLIQVGKVVGVGWTILLLVADSILGGWLIRREGARAFRAFGTALSQGRMPSKEIADGICVLAGGILMLSPGFVLDAVGLVLVLPVTRPLARGLLTRFVEARMLGFAPGAAGFGPGRGGAGGPFGPGAAPDEARRPRPDGQGPVVEGEVLDD